MKVLVRKILTAVCLSGCLSACSSSTWQARTITDVNNLNGLRVGVNLSWESDYVLSNRSDMELFRYDTTADMMMALNYDKIDAIAADLLMCNMMTSTAVGIKRVDPCYAMVGYALYFRPEKKDVMEEFNAFLAEYKKTDAYRDFLHREETFSETGSQPADIPLTGTGEKLIVAADAANCYPRCFVETDGTVAGFDTEALKLFANEKNYQLEFLIVDYENAIVGLKNGIYDISVGYISDAYRSEAEQSGVLVSDTFDETPLFFLQKTQQTISYDYELFE